MVVKIQTVYLKKQTLSMLLSKKTEDAILGAKFYKSKPKKPGTYYH
jgi:hypothetical protein